ncbi:uncharacterized protein AMSG_02171 [Thecamonas trahens ATCC 50062]|uniref:Uncharacterized protein n=1 Tax=Thecamonas trahens ATCC 50062 TaxID=461836 RepID=A0A0L0DVB5_THETB|nr:hypothetical protein AMSG_02171 [Thecamonas trahens ATCC 50062]KNC56155.1 hypothetical protein AMSG_02171 [Thecamonas trahens ATCC 50062]|eukprot:XP_013761192.1 hypothetical protein AMSG_02171 [Thecamonas trahens ATCC 50062]
MLRMTHHTLGIIPFKIGSIALQLAAVLPGGSESPVPRIPVIGEILVHLIMAGGALIRDDLASAQFLVDSASKLVGSIMGVVSEEAVICHVLFSMYYLDGSPQRARAHGIMARDMILRLAAANKGLFVLESSRTRVARSSTPTCDSPSSVAASIERLPSDSELTLHGLQAWLFRMLRLRVAAHEQVPHPPTLHSAINDIYLLYPVFTRILASFVGAMSRSTFPLVAEASTLLLAFLGERNLDLSVWNPMTGPVSPTSPSVVFLIALIRRAEEDSANFGSVPNWTDTIRAGAPAILVRFKSHLEDTESLEADPFLVLFRHTLKVHIALLEIMLSNIMPGLEAMNAAIAELLGEGPSPLLYSVMFNNSTLFAIQAYIAILFRDTNLAGGVAAVSAGTQSRTIGAFLTLLRIAFSSSPAELARAGIGSAPPDINTAPASATGQPHPGPSKDAQPPVPIPVPTPMDVAKSIAPNPVPVPLTVPTPAPAPQRSAKNPDDQRSQGSGSTGGNSDSSRSTAPAAPGSAALPGLTLSAAHMHAHLRQIQALNTASSGSIPSVSLDASLAAIASPSIYDSSFFDFEFSSVGLTPPASAPSSASVSRSSAQQSESALNSTAANPGVVDPGLPNPALPQS